MPRHRVEDARLLTGGGRYTADLVPDGAAQGAFLRAPHTHAELGALDVAAASAMPGVLAVVTGAELRALGWGRAPHAPGQRNADGAPLVVPDWPPLAAERVRFVGEPVALVVAETRAQAMDAAEAIGAPYRELPVATFPAGSPPIWPHAPDNIALDYAAGDAAACAEAFAAAAHVVEAEIRSQRLAVAPMEPRSAVAWFDAATGRRTLLAGSQGAAALRDQLAFTMGCAPETVRVLSEDVGGGFGAKLHLYAEYLALLAAAERCGRPVCWTATRSEAFLTDTQARDSVLRGRLACDARGRFLAVEVASDVNLGAYQSSHAAMTATANLWRCLVGPYATPRASARIRCRYSNTVPTAPYRGAGRPEAALIMEHLADRAANALGLDRAEIRRRNLIAPTALPHRAGNGMVYDSGDFPAALDQALAAADHAGFPARREAARRAGRLRGIGIGCYVEIAGGLPWEDVRIEARPGGTLVVQGGFHPNGQGHATVFPALVAGELGLPMEQVVLGPGDSALVPRGAGSFGSRSMTVGGAACLRAAAALREAAIGAAAGLLGVPPDGLRWADGAVRRHGDNRPLTLADLVEAGGPIVVQARAEAPPTFPSGAHVAEIEIEPETGAARWVGHVAVDDIGRVIHPVLAHGQAQGGIAQGLGQVLVEGVVHDAAAQMLTASFMDYALPRADDLPAYVTRNLECPANGNPLRTKGAGEGGTTGALAAGHAALLDALAQAGATAIAMPATPARIWAALRGRPA